jgi:signal transduction histidine kinase
MQQKTDFNRWHLARIAQIVVSVWLVAALLLVVLAIPMLNPPQHDIVSLLLMMGVVGSVSIVGSYGLYRAGLMNRFRSLHYALMGISILTIGIALFNCWLLARQMFIEYHDLTLNFILLLFAGWTAIGCGYFIGWGLTERITLVSEGAKRLAAGDLSVRVAAQGNDELASLATTFNTMAARLQESAEQRDRLEQARRDLIAWASHDLRTPLASLRLVVDAMIDGVADDEATRQRYLKTAQLEIVNLNSLISDLFELSQLDTGHIDLKIERTSLSDMLSDTLSALRTLAEQRGIQLEGRVDDGIDPVEIDPEKIQRVLYNLLTNAIRHTPAGGDIRVSAMRKGDLVNIAIRDTGEGIPAEDLPRIFERFYRGEQARTRDLDGQRGAGLGLAIARGLVEAHGGTISVESILGEGTTFTIRLRRSLVERAKRGDQNKFREAMAKVADVEPDKQDRL